VESGGAKEPGIRQGSDSLMRRGILRGKGTGQCKVQRLSAASYANKSSAVAEMGDRLATIDIAQKVWGCCALFRGEIAGFPSNTMSPGPRPTSIPTGTLTIHPTVWPQYTNVPDRTDTTDSRMIL